MLMNKDTFTKNVTFAIVTKIKNFSGYVPDCSMNSPCYLLDDMISTMCGSREGTGGPDSPENHKKGVLAILVQIPLKITKLPSQHSMFDHHRHANETPFKFRWRADDGPILVVFGSTY